MKTTDLKIKAFTLLELLFVIVIISVLATAGLAVVKQHAQEAKVEKCVSQIKQILQAATAYYVDNNCWPNSTSCKSGSPSFKDNYISIGDKDAAGQNYVNPWGLQYSFNLGINEHKFQVSTTAPNAMIAQRIVGMLSNAAVDANINTKISAETIIPKSATGDAVYLIQQFRSSLPGLVDTVTQDISGITCPAGYISAIYLSLESFTDNNPADQGGYPYVLTKSPTYTIDPDNAGNTGCVLGTGVCNDYTVKIDFTKTGGFMKIWATGEWYAPDYKKYLYDATDYNVRYYTQTVLRYSVYCCKAHYDFVERRMVSYYCQDYSAYK